MSSPEVPGILVISRDNKTEYSLSKEIGRGSHGRVYLAIHISDLKNVAIKRISREVIGKYVFPEREYRVLKELQHPNIVSVLDHLKGTMYDYLVFEYVEKGDLLEFVNKRKIPFSERDLTRLLFQLSSAVSFIHSLFYIHLDIKLENILIADQTPEHLEVKLCDFGFVRKYSPDERVFYACGSQHYAAPELLFEDPIFGPEADVWSLGTSVYTAATGVFLVNVKDPVESLRDFRENGVYIPHDSFLPLKVRKVLIKMLRYDPDSRITAAEILKDEIFNEKSQMRRLDLTHPLEGSSSLSSATEESSINSPTLPLQLSP